VPGLIRAKLACVALLLATSIDASAGVALAQPASKPPVLGANCGATETGPNVDPYCHAEGEAVTPGSTGSATASTTPVRPVSTGPTIQYVAYDRLVVQPNGEACVTTGYYAEGARPPSDAVNVDPVTQTVNQVHDLAALEYPPCPEQPRPPGAPAPAEAPSMVARRYWELVPLPRPQPFIAPGRAITGMLAYLETRGEVTYAYTNDTVFGPLEIVATGRYYVDWGDGTEGGPYAHEGGAWPDGRITHQYTHVGAYDLVVTERWTATWTLGGHTGRLRTLQTVGRIDGFPVQQIQAVIRR
jgi:hypothetical protein